VSGNIHLVQPLRHDGEPLQSARRVALVMHGRGQTKMWSRQNLVERLTVPGTAFVSPTAANDSWYPDGFMAERDANEPWLGWTMERLDTLVEGLIAGGRARAEIVFIGFSQGACAVAEYLVEHPGRYGGAAILTGGLIGPEGTSWPDGSLGGTPVFLSTGDADEWVPQSRVDQTAVELERRGAIVTYEVYVGREHIVSDDEIERVAKLLESVG
jgi:predicted esterase